ncbi:hypothetical protein G6F22_018411 [Rhizopus arrhizus]|nr:hypothetical protein G6F22_018411 [Rhizopus arrhizus]KAG1165802.1 hypothetical protein G6F35_018563 [Rhizopus arrhizus]
MEPLERWRWRQCEERRLHRKRGAGPGLGQFGARVAGRLRHLERADRLPRERPRVTGTECEQPVRQGLLPAAGQRRHGQRLRRTAQRHAEHARQVLIEPSGEKR